MNITNSAIFTLVKLPSWLVLSLCYMSVTSASASASATEATHDMIPKIYNVGYYHAPPFAYHHKGRKPTGFLISFYDKLFKLSGLQYQLIHIPPNRLARLIDKKIIHVKFSQKNSPYEDVLLYGKDVIWQLEVRIYWKKKSLPLQSLKAIKNKRVILTHGFNFGDLKEKIINMGVSSHSAPNFISAVKMFNAERGDYLLIYKSIFDSITPFNEHQNYKYLSIFTSDFYITINKHVNNAEGLLEKLSNAYYELKKTGEIEQIIEGASDKLEIK